MLLDYIDLTHVLEEKTPMYPGLESPKIKILSSIASRGCMISSVSFISHTGTHMDAPCHFIKGGRTIDAIGINELIARPVIIKLAPNQKNIRKEDIIPYEAKIDEKTVLILNTGIDKKYGTRQYFNDFPTLTDEAAVWIAKKRPAIVATDASSVDPVNSKEKFIHRTLLGMNIILVESITNISLIKEDFHVCLFIPLKIKGIDGSPCRAFALNPDIINKILLPNK